MTLNKYLLNKCMYPHPLLPTPYKIFPNYSNSLGFPTSPYFSVFGAPRHLFLLLAILLSHGSICCFPFPKENTVSVSPVLFPPSVGSDGSKISNL